MEDKQSSGKSDSLLISRPKIAYAPKVQTTVEVIFSFNSTLHSDLEPKVFMGSATLDQYYKYHQRPLLSKNIIASPLQFPTVITDH